MSEENHLVQADEINKPTEDVSPIPTKIPKPKRNPFEKIITESIMLCSEIEKDTNEANLDKLIKVIEKEVMKKEEYYKLIQLYEKTKKLKEESDISTGFIQIKTDLENLKNNFQHKNKIKRPLEDGDDGVQTKKKKKDSKRSAKIVDSSEIVSKLSKREPEDLAVLGNIPEECRSEIILNEEQMNNIIISPAVEEVKNDKASKTDGAKDKKEVKDGSAKKKLLECNNKNILNFFKPKQNSIAPSGTSSVLKAKASQQLTEVDPIHIVDLTNIDLNDICEKSERLVFTYRPSGKKNISLVDYNTDLIDENYSQPKKGFYTLKYEEISNKSKYLERFNKYFSEVSKESRQSIIKKKRRLIYIHDSFLSLRKIADKSSTIINPKNPFKKDDYLIDYDKDSEEEFLEENAEDIKSNENSADEEESEEEEEGNKWIVPDGHLSEDEVSQQEVLEEDFKKRKSIMDVLEIRKNYTKPVLVNFNNVTESKIKQLKSMLKAKFFSLDSEQNSFPVKLVSKNKEETKNKGMKESIKDRLNDIVRDIHMSFMTKEYLIKTVIEKFDDISKKSLCTFFKDSVIKARCKVTFRKQWLVKKEVLDNSDLLPSEFNKLFERHNSVYEEKEKDRKKEVEENQQNTANIMNEHFTHVNQLNPLEPQFDLVNLDFDKKSKPKKIKSEKKSKLSSKKKFDLNKINLFALTKSKPDT